MDEQELDIKINEILSMQGDPEMAHHYEDRLHLQLIEAYCPNWAVERIKKLNNADFPRWCA